MHRRVWRRGRGIPQWAPAGTSAPTRIWVIGDAGTGGEGPRRVRDAYPSFAGATPNLWLMLGDNALRIDWHCFKTRSFCSPTSRRDAEIVHDAHSARSAGARTQICTAWHVRCCLHGQKGGNNMAARYLVVSFAVALLAGCAAQQAVAGDPCFFKGTMFSTGANSCQSGTSYRCADGEWASLGVACSEGSVALSKTCRFGGISFSTGAASCQAGTQFRCEDGEWRGIGAPCSAGDSPIKVAPSGRTCMFNDATVASNSTICRSGTTYLCNDGEWLNLGTMCR